MLYVNLTTPEQSVKIKTPFFSEEIRDYLLHIGVSENLSRIKLSNKEDSPIRITLSGYILSMTDTSRKSSHRGILCLN